VFAHNVLCHVQALSLIVYVACSVLFVSISQVIGCEDRL